MASGMHGSGSSSQTSERFVLYGYPECPYCRRVLSAIESLGLDIPLRNTMRDEAANDELFRATGRETVPVLQITAADGSVRWMPESLEIVQFLKERFGTIRA